MLLDGRLTWRYLTPEIQTTLVLPGHIKTHMFEKTVLPDERLAPSLMPAEVSQAIIESLEGTTLDNILRIPHFTWVARLLYRGSDLVPRVVRRLQHWVRHRLRCRSTWVADRAGVESRLGHVPVRTQAGRWRAFDAAAHSERGD